jgi:hypothetical protein
MGSEARGNARGTEPSPDRSGRVARAPTTMPLQLSRCWVRPDWWSGACEQAGSEGVEPPAGGFGDRGATVARAREEARMTWCARMRRRWCLRVRAESRLPARDGRACIRERPSSRIVLMIERRSGSARERAEARQGLRLELWFGDRFACHRGDTLRFPPRVVNAFSRAG